MRNVSENVYLWLSKMDAKFWYKVFFIIGSVCEKQSDNDCESFNSKIKKAQGQPVLTLLKDVRIYIRDRWNKKEGWIMA